MITVQDDWIQYEGVPARRVVVRGGAACATRMPVVRSRPVVAVVPDRRPAPRRGVQPRLRLTRRGRLLLAVVPALLAVSGAFLAAGAGSAEATPRQPVAPAAATVAR